MNKPNLESAAVTARVISKLLLKHDFPRAGVRHQYYTSEGFVVHRVGYAPIVHVSYHVFDSCNNEKDRARRQRQEERMREVLFELGYVSKHDRAIYINCKTR